MKPVKKAVKIIDEKKLSTTNEKELSKMIGGIRRSGFLITGRECDGINNL